MSLPQVRAEGTLVADIDLRFVGDHAVANFTIACNARKFNKDTNKWEDGAVTYLDCAVWKQAAENAAENLTKGSRVLVFGQLKQENWESKEGQKRSKLKLEVEEIGSSLKFAQSGPKKAQDPWTAPSASPDW